MQLNTENAVQTSGMNRFVKEGSGDNNVMSAHALETRPGAKGGGSKQEIKREHGWTRFGIDDSEVDRAEHKYEGLYERFVVGSKSVIGLERTIRGVASLDGQGLNGERGVHSASLQAKLRKSRRKSHMRGLNVHKRAGPLEIEGLGDVGWEPWILGRCEKERMR